MLPNRIQDLMEMHPQVLWGFTTTSGSVYETDFSAAVVLAVPYAERISVLEYRHEKYEKLVDTAKEKAEILRSALAWALRREGASVAMPSAVQTNEESLEAPLSFKDAAVRSGLGWIGKNGVLITPQYGPHVYLTALVTDALLPVKEAITKSFCPQGCTACIDACPCGALKGRRWEMGLPRRELIDYHKCNERRSRFIGMLGRKHPCGLCLIACPIGSNALFK